MTNSVSKYACVLLKTMSGLSTNTIDWEQEEDLTLSKAEGKNSRATCRRKGYKNIHPTHVFHYHFPLVKVKVRVFQNLNSAMLLPKGEQLAITTGLLRKKLGWS